MAQVRLQRVAVEVVCSDSLLQAVEEVHLQRHLHVAAHSGRQRLWLHWSTVRLLLLLLSPHHLAAVVVHLGEELEVRYQSHLAQVVGVEEATAALALVPLVQVLQGQLEPLVVQRTQSAHRLSLFKPDVSFRREWRMYTYHLRYHFRQRLAQLLDGRILVPVVRLSVDR
jgi:hypothetical protein